MRKKRMNGFVDIHTHILPGVDDGAQSEADAFALIDIALKGGTKTIILTPHYRGAYRKHTPEFLKEAFAAFELKVKARYPDMKLYLGNEILYESDAPERLADGKILSMNGTQYALLEFKPSSLRSRIISGVTEMLYSGFTPIIAHVDRYDAFIKDKTLTDEVINMGALIQVNADSVMGKRGFGVKHFCHKLLKAGKVHFVATDAHDTSERPSDLGECFAKVEKKYGSDYAAQIFRENALAVIEDQVI